MADQKLVDELMQPVQTADGAAPKPGFNWTRLIITILIVIVTTAAMGGGVWYYMNQQSLKSDDAKNKEVEELQKQIDELKKPAASSATTTATQATASPGKTYSDPGTAVGFKYPTEYTVSDVTSSQVGTDGNSPWYGRSDFVKRVLEFKSGIKTFQVKIVLTNEKGKAIGSFGGAGTEKESFAAGSNTGYLIGNYGQGPASTAIEAIVVGNQYSVAAQAEDSSYTAVIKDLISSVTFK